MPIRKKREGETNEMGGRHVGKKEKKQMSYPVINHSGGKRKNLPSKLEKS